MGGWFKNLVADKDGNPNEHIIAAVWGSLMLLGLSFFLCYTGHTPTLADYGIAHSAVWGTAGVAQRISGGM